MYPKYRHTFDFPSTEASTENRNTVDYVCLFLASTKLVLSGQTFSVSVLRLTISENFGSATRAEILKLEVATDLYFTFNFLKNLGK